jgi:rod shape-determining protein MreC
MAVYRRASRRRYILLVIVLTSVTLITLDTRRHDNGPIGVVARGAHAVVAPVQKSVDSVTSPVGDWFSTLGDNRKLKQENAKLQRELDQVRDDERRAHAVLKQNSDLQKLSELPIYSSIEQHVARVVNTAPGNFEWTVTIDKGEEHGISQDMPVISANGLVGRVLESFHGTATVLLLRDPQSSVSVRIDPSGVSGLARGREGSKELVVDIDDDEAKIKVGDSVVTSGKDNSSFPENLSVGKVVSVDHQGAGLGQTVRVKPYVDFAALEYVKVLVWVPGEGPVVSTTTTTAGG